MVAAPARGADAIRGVPLSPEQVERRRRTAIEHNTGRHLLPGYNGFNVHKWTEEEDELLRTLPPAEVARQTGRTLYGIYRRRSDLGLPDGRRRASDKS
jgi:hypothetical protein